MTKTLATNDMRRNIQNIVDITISKFKKKITSTDEKLVQNAVFRLIYLEKANLVHYKGAKRNIDVLYMDTTTNVKLSKLDTKFA